MNPFRKKQVVAAALDALALADGYPLAADVLRSYVRDLVKPPVTDDEWATLLPDLQGDNLIALVPCKFDKELVQYTLTERGDALIKSQA